MTLNVGGMLNTNSYTHKDADQTADAQAGQLLCCSNRFSCDRADTTLKAKFLHGNLLRKIHVQIFYLKCLADLYLHRSKHLFCAFIDYKKAFDSANYCNKTSMVKVEDYQ